MQILETHQGTSTINALCLGTSFNALYEFFPETSEKVVATYFHNLPILKYLNIMWVDSVDGDFKNLLPNLRWFQCSTEKFSTNNLSMKNLVILELRHVNLADDWNELKKAYNLKALDLSLCKNLQALPNLSNLTKLVELRLLNCDKLIEIQGLESLKILDAKECGSLMKIGRLEEHLDLGDCYELQSLGNKLKAPRFQDTGDFSRLKELQICNSNIMEIQGIARLEYLHVLEIRFCHSLEKSV